jgi:hypothetical protein
LNELVLLLLALPLVALPPVVLLVTVALPELALCELVLVSTKLLVLLTCVEELTLELIVLVLFGPVLVISPATAGVTIAPAPPSPADVLLTPTEALKPLLLLALPEVAPPPVVFVDVVAEPVLAPWPLLLLAVTLLWLLTR